MHSSLTESKSTFNWPLENETLFLTMSIFRHKDAWDALRSWASRPAHDEVDLALPRAADKRFRSRDDVHVALAYRLQYISSAY